MTDLITQRLAQLTTEHAAAVQTLQASESYRRVLVIEAAIHELQTLLAAMAAPLPSDVPDLLPESSIPDG
jgi:cephalosporin hydroxylase